jgi:HEAT repeat protein
MKNISTKLAAVAIVLGAMSAPALAGKGGSYEAIQAAVASGSPDAIVAEVERAEALICEQCVNTVLALTADDRYKVREVAAWWFARRPGSTKILATQFVGELGSSDSTQVRNAADFLGAVMQFDALPALKAAYARGGLSVDARFAIVRAVGVMAHASGNAILAAAMADADATVRAQAVIAWRDVRGQQNAAPARPLLGDSDANVRAQAATVLGAYKDAAVVGALGQLVVSDPSAVVRRNAAWALGQIGSRDAYAALTAATQDASGLVRNVAKVALGRLQ